MVAPSVTPETLAGGPPPVVITSPKKTLLYSGGDYPPEVKAAVSDFSCGKTTDPITSFLRWESVRARTVPAEAARIREQVRRIDYAVVNTTIRDDMRLYVGLNSEQSRRVRNDSVFAENGYLIATYDPSVIYRRSWSTGRDRDGYVTMCVLDFHKGDHILFVNASEREFLLPRGGTWDVTNEEVYDQLAFSADSVPLYDDIVQTDVRMIYTRERP
jgi:hypothetical protein